MESLDTDLARFQGPLFIVGMPRSGTKLLREMLNGHTRIRIPEVETNCYPYWVARWDRWGPIDTPPRFEQFYRECVRLPFFSQIHERGLELEWPVWFEACRAFTPSGVFEALLKSVLSIPLNDRSTIWGDKSPSYIRHIRLLNREFPDARIIHIIRDVRDYALSMRKAWGKSPVRAAQRWHDDIAQARADGINVGRNYKEIRYEELISEPRATLICICDFLEIEFQDRLMNLHRAPENIGAAAGLNTVLHNNSGKYVTQMPAKMVVEIERVSCVQLRDMHYPCSYEGDPVRVPKWKLRWLQLLDGLRLLRSSVNRHGLVGGLKVQLRHFKTSGNRIT
jgi:hypothetical protein